jgi:hypothetical protein
MLLQDSSGHAELLFDGIGVGDEPPRNTSELPGTAVTRLPASLRCRIPRGQVHALATIAQQTAARSSASAVDVLETCCRNRVAAAELLPL